jgi:hypothetical protein
MSFDMHEQLCPQCRYTFNAATVIQGAGPPEPGDLTLCIRCGSILGWNFRMELEALSVAAIRELDTETLQLLARAQRLIFKGKAERN